MAIHSALAALNVVEVGQFLSVSSVGRHLVNLGANVCKIEQPGGDGMRTWGVLGDDGVSLWYRAQNVGKHIVEADLKTDHGRRVLACYLAGTDVLIHNLRPPTARAFGITDEALTPSQTVVSIVGNFDDDRPAFGNIVECASGFRSLTGYPDEAPVRVGCSIADEAAALHAVSAVLASVIAGGGHRVEVSLLHSVAGLNNGAFTEYAATGVPRARLGNAHSSTAPCGTYRTFDGLYVAISANTEKQAESLAFAVARQQVLDADYNPQRWGDNARRMSNVTAIDVEIAEWARMWKRAALVERLERVGVPCSPVNDVGEALAAHTSLIETRNGIVVNASPMRDLA